MLTFSVPMAEKVSDDPCKLYDLTSFAETASSVSPGIKQAVGANLRCC